MVGFDISKEIGAIASRDKMIRYFDGYSSERMDELAERKTKRPLVKSYMLEHVGSAGSQKHADDLLNNNGMETIKIDENLFQVRDKRRDGEYMGFIEVLNPRYFVFYTIHHSEKSDRWINDLVLNSHELDHVWLSGLTFNVLWQRVAQLTKPNRYVSMLFVHESIYQIDNEYDGNEEEEEEDITTSPDDMEVKDVVEKRASKFRLVDKIHTVQKNLEQLQQIYSPLYAISQLRFPSPTGRGGHDFFDYGKVTNRSGDFRDHRLHILYVQRIYENLIRETEQKAWHSIEQLSAPAQFHKIIGSPVTIKFRDRLNKETFDYWISSTFGRTKNRFRLWGNPIVLGPTKVHVYGLDKHLWKPIFLEITDEHLIAMLPKGTCGNTIHRLICNIQRYIDPGAEAYIGETEYKSIVDKSSKGINYEPRD